MTVFLVIKLAIILILFFPATLFAESIVLKSGKKIEGKIIERADQYIKIEFEGRPLYYELKYIKGIEEDSPTAADVNFYLKNGLKYGSEAKFKEAEEELKKGLVINPAEHNLQEILKIIEDLKNGIIREEYAVHLLKGSYYLMNAEYQPAITEFKEALKLNPDNADLYYYLGVCKYSLEQYEEAVTYLKKAAEAKPDDDEVYYYLGINYYSLGQYPQAITYMQKVLKINPDDAEAYSIIATSKYLLGQIQEAKEAFYKAIELFKKKGDYLKAMDIEEFLGRLN